MKSKLPIGDYLTLDMIHQFLGVPPMMKKFIKTKDGMTVIDLMEDRLYILKKTGHDEVYLVKAFMSGRG